MTFVTAVRDTTIVREGNIRIIYELIDRGGDVDRRNNEGKTPLDMVRAIKGKAGLQKPSLAALFKRPPQEDIMTEGKTAILSPHS